MTESKTAILQKCADRLNGGVIKDEWREYPTYKLLLMLEQNRHGGDTPDVSTSSRLWNRDTI